MIKNPVLVAVLASLAMLVSNGVAAGDTFDTITVPEPASLLLFGTGVGAVLMVQRWRNRR